MLHTFDKSKGLGAANRGRHSDPRVDELIQKALATVDSDARGKLLAEATKTTASEEIPVLVLKSIFVRYVNSGTKITPPPTPRRPDNMPPVKPIIK